MREFHEIQKQHDTWQKIINSKWFLLFLGICIFFLTRGVIRIYSKYRVIQHDYSELQTDVQALQHRDAELDTYIKRIDSEEGKDYEIRKKLDVAKPGEKTLYIVDTP